MWLPLDKTYNAQTFLKRNLEVIIYKGIYLYIESFARDEFAVPYIVPKSAHKAIDSVTLNRACID